MDNFVEQLIVKRPDMRDTIKRAAILLVGSLLVAVFILLAMEFLPILFMFALGVVYLMYFLLSGTYTEYEYIVTNNELDIDKISGKRKRKRLITLKLNSAELWKEYDDNVGTKSTATVEAHSNMGFVWCLAAGHEKYGKVLLLFSPNEKVRAAVNKAVPGSVRLSQDLIEAKTEDGGE